MAEAESQARSETRHGAASVEARLLREALDDRERAPTTGGSSAEFLMRAYAWLVVSLAFVEAVLAFRFGFLLVGADRDSGIVDIIYRPSDPIVAPFTGMVSRAKLGAGTVDPSVLIAMVAYLAGGLTFMCLTCALWLAARTRDRSASGKEASDEARA